MIATYKPHHLPDNRSESSKIFQNITDLSVIIPWNAQVNDSNFEKVVLLWFSQLSWSSMAFSEETLITKELMLLNSMVCYTSTAKDIGFKIFRISTLVR